jgi:hypothetical protein
MGSGSKVVPALAALALLAVAPAAQAGGYGDEKPYGYPKHGTVTIVKETLPAGSPQRFTFAPSAGLSATRFELGDREWVSLQSKPGTHTVTEDAVDGWIVDSITCDDADSTGAGDTATIVVAPGEHVVCTFVNAEQDTPAPPSPPAVPVVPPAPPSSGLVPTVIAPSSGVLGTTARNAVATARLSRPSACVSNQVRVTVSGSPIRRIAFTVDGRLVRTYLTPRRRGPFRVTLPAGTGRVSDVTARVVFSNGVRSRTLRTTLAHCAQSQVVPQFTG